MAQGCWSILSSKVTVAGTQQEWGTCGSPSRRFEKGWVLTGGASAIHVCALSRLSSQAYLLGEWSPVLGLQHPSIVWFCNSCNSPREVWLPLIPLEVRVGKRNLVERICSCTGDGKSIVSGSLGLGPACPSLLCDLGKVWPPLWAWVSLISPMLGLISLLWGLSCFCKFCLGQNCHVLGREAESELLKTRN